MKSENLINIIREIEEKISAGNLPDVEDYKSLIMYGHEVLQSYDSCGGYVGLSSIIEKAKER